MSIKRCTRPSIRNLKLIATSALVAAGLLAATSCGDDGQSAAAPLPGTPLNQEAMALLQLADDQVQGIAVSGQGRVNVSPDMALLNLGVSAKEATAQGAREAAAAAMTRLLDSLHANAIAEEDIQSTQFTLRAEYAYPEDGEPYISGYRVTNMVSVKARDLNSVGKVIDDAVDAVGNPIQVQGITFTVSEPGGAEEQARRLAMAQARERAEQWAQLAGVNLGKPIAIVELGVQLPPKFSAESRALAEAATPISPGQLEVVVSVQVAYAIR